jgi:outer membrane lipoprotein SlyB
MNTATIESLGANVETRPARPKLLYPALVIAAISVTMFSLLGIAALTGVMPSAHSNPLAAATTKSAPTEKSARISTQTSTPKTRVATASCADCGKVESVTTVERPANTTGVGAVAGGLTGALLGNQIGRGDGRTVMTLAGGAGGAYLGNKIEQNTRRTTAYKIVVRMENGSQRTIYQNESPNVVIGGPVQIVGNSVVART